MTHSRASAVFDSAVTRVIGVLALFGFVVSGAFAIADPEWLRAAPDLGHAEPSDGRAAGHAGRPGQPTAGATGAVQDS